jgi:hypothetical protein
LPSAARIGRPAITVMVREHFGNMRKQLVQQSLAL